MRIFFEGLSLFPPRTGIGRSSLQMIHALARHPEISEIHLFFSLVPYTATRIRWISSLERLHSKIRVHLIPLPYGALLYLWDHYQWPRVDQIWKQMDLIHAPNYVLPPLDHAPGVITIHDLSLVKHPEWYPSSAHPLIKRIGAGIARADQIVCPSRAVRDEILEEYRMEEDRVHVVPHAIHDNYKPADTEEKIRIRKRFFGRDISYLFWCGEINPRKNVSLIVDVLVGLRKRGFDSLQLVIVGTVGYRGEAVLEYARNQNLKWVLNPVLKEACQGDILQYGFVSEETLSSLYSAADLMIFPSWDEGFGFPVLEAMASGVPVLAANQGSLPELMQDAGILLDPARGSEIFVEQAEHLLKNGMAYQRYREQGILRAKVYQELAMEDLLTDVYREAIREKKSVSNGSQN